MDKTTHAQAESHQRLDSSPGHESEKPTKDRKDAPATAAAPPLKGRAEAEEREDANPRPADAGADVAWAGQGTRDGP